MPMTDTALDATTGDFLMVDGNFVVFTDPGDALVQAIRIALRTWKGEWFLDANFGVDYQGKILIKNPSRARVVSLIRATVLAVPGVKRIVRLEVDYDRAARTFKITSGLVEGDEVALVEFIA